MKTMIKYPSVSAIHADVEGFIYAALYTKKVKPRCNS